MPALRQCGNRHAFREVEGGGVSRVAQPVFGLPIRVVRLLLTSTYARVAGTGLVRRDRTAQLRTRLRSRRAATSR